MEFQFTGWVCTDCHLTNAGYDAKELGYENADGTVTWPSGEEPWNLLEVGTIVTPGLLDSEHECEDRWIGHRSEIGCGEEVRDFATNPCDGCSTPLAGERHAYTFWYEAPVSQPDSADDK